MDSSFDRPWHWLNWATGTFGEIAKDPTERCLRFAEEAIELSHALGVNAATLAAIIERVYARPAGGVEREIGQTQATLELLAKVLGIDADAEATAELARIKRIPAAEWAKRHAAKVAIGIAR